VFSGAVGDADDACRASADRSCGHINFFTSARAARTWAKANPAVTGRILGRAGALSAGVAEFGGFMRTEDGTGLPAGPGQR
jgi:hypothetical protein